MVSRFTSKQFVNGFVYFGSFCLLTYALYEAFQTGKASNIINSLFGLFMPFLLFQFLLMRVGLTWSSVFGSYMMVSAQLCILLVGLFHLHDGLISPYLLVMVTPFSLMGLGMGWLLGILIEKYNPLNKKRAH